MMVHGQPGPCEPMRHLKGRPCEAALTPRLRSDPRPCRSDVGPCRGVRRQFETVLQDPAPIQIERSIQREIRDLPIGSIRPSCPPSNELVHGGLEVRLMLSRHRIEREHPPIAEPCHILSCSIREASRDTDPDVGRTVNRSQLSRDSQCARLDGGVARQTEPLQGRRSLRIDDRGWKPRRRGRTGGRNREDHEEDEEDGRTSS